MQTPNSDDTLITSTARKKRKAGECLRSPAKRAAGTDNAPRAQLSKIAGAANAEVESEDPGCALASGSAPTAIEVHRENDSPHPPHAAHGEHDEGQGVLFSPGFHTIPGASHPPGRPDSEGSAEGGREAECVDNQPTTVSNLSSRTQVAAEVTSTTGGLVRRHGEAAGRTVRARPQAELASTETPGDELDNDEEADDYSFDPFTFIKNLPPLEHCFPTARGTLLPRQTRRSKQKTLVLDLDETLVHSSLENFDNPDFTFPVEVNNVVHVVNVKKRPHLAAFLEAVSRSYEVVVFTASQRIYAEQLLNVIDPQRRHIKYRLYRDACVYVDGNYLKDLTVLGRDLRHTIIVDNSPQAFGFQLSNGIPIESWYDNDHDQELMHLLEFLNHLILEEDVRPLITRTFKLHQLVAQA